MAHVETALAEAPQPERVSDDRVAAGHRAGGAVTIRNLSKSYVLNGRPFPVLDRVSHHVAAGEVLAIVGASGSGKTRSCTPSRSSTCRALGGKSRRWRRNPRAVRGRRGIR